MRKWEPLLRIPFVDGGRNLEGCDCWGLLRLVYQRDLGIELPTYGTISTSDMTKVVRQISKGWNEPIWSEQPRKELKEYDAVVMALPGRRFPAHVGIFVGRDKMIHTEDGTGPVIVSVDHITVATRILGYRRHINANV